MRLGKGLTMLVACAVTATTVGAAATAHAADEGATLLSRWENGPPGRADYFPIAVWLQDPRLAPQYKEAGVNLFIGLYKGPTREQLELLRDADMPVICSQNDFARSLLKSGDPLADIIVGWTQQDEPDNAQRKESGEGYDPPVTPEEVMKRYRAMQRVDDSRPVFLNLSQGVAWEQWIGRGVRTGHLEDYPHYVRAADIVSFDIYPVAHKKVQGELWYVAQGVERLVDWTGGRKPVWNCIEASRINSEHLATPEQIRSEIWMSIIHGSRGIVYFAHEWKPKFDASAMLTNEQTRRGVTRINKQIQELAAVINSQPVNGAAAVETQDDVPIATTARVHDHDLYIFAVTMRDKATDASFHVRYRGVKPGATVEVLGEDRQLQLDGRDLQDHFGPYETHLYRITGAR